MWKSSTKSVLPEEELKSTMGLLNEGWPVTVLGKVEGWSSYEAEGECREEEENKVEVR